MEAYPFPHTPDDESMAESLLTGIAHGDNGVIDLADVLSEARGLIMGDVSLTVKSALDLANQTLSSALLAMGCKAIRLTNINWINTNLLEGIDLVDQTIEGEADALSVTFAGQRPKKNYHDEATGIYKISGGEVTPYGDPVIRKNSGII